MDLDDRAGRGPGGLSPAEALAGLARSAAEPGGAWRSLAVAFGVVGLAVVGAVIWWRSSSAEVAPVVPASIAMAPGVGAAPGGTAPSGIDGAPGTQGAGGGAGGGAAGAAVDGAGTSGSPVVHEVVVHAAGAVTQPGVHRLPAGARVGDVLAAAGGAAPDADVERLNLAAPVEDGARVYVPRKGEEPPAALVPDTGPAAGAAVAAGSPGGPSPAAPLDLNRADAAALDELPGVGPATAQAILDHRERHGPFASVDDLLGVRGIGPAKLEALRELVRV